MSTTFKRFLMNSAVVISGLVAGVLPAAASSCGGDDGAVPSDPKRAQISIDETGAMRLDTYPAILRPDDKGGYQVGTLVRCAMTREEMHGVVVAAAKVCGLKSDIELELAYQNRGVTDQVLSTKAATFCDSAHKSFPEIPNGDKVRNNSELFTGQIIRPTPIL